MGWRVLWKPPCDLASSSSPLLWLTMFPPQISKLLPEHSKLLSANLFPVLTSLSLLFIHCSWNYLSPEIIFFSSEEKCPPTVLSKWTAPRPLLLPTALLYYYYFFITLDVLVHICFVVVMVHCLSTSWDSGLLSFSFTAISPVLGTEPRHWLLFMKCLLNEWMREKQRET